MMISVLKRSALHHEHRCLQCYAPDSLQDLTSEVTLPSQMLYYFPDEYEYIDIMTLTNEGFDLIDPQSLLQQ